MKWLNRFSGSFEDPAAVLMAVFGVIVLSLLIVHWPAGLSLLCAVILFGVVEGLLKGRFEFNLPAKSSTIMGKGFICLVAMALFHHGAANHHEVSASLMLAVVIVLSLVKQTR